MPLVSARARRAGHVASSAASGSGSGSRDIDLPPYEPLSCALSEEAKRALAGLSNSREITRRYEDHIAKSRTHLGRSVTSITDRLLARRGELDQLSQRRAEKGSDKTQKEQELEQWLPKLDSEVSNLSANLEKAVRDLVDRQAQVQDDKEATRAMAAYFDTQPSRQRPLQRRRTRDNPEEDVANEEEPPEEEEAPPPEQDPLSVLDQQRADKSTEYEAMDYHQRYALNNDYASFRKLWHDAKFPDQEVPLPDPSRWFDAEGNPIQAKPRGQRGAAGMKAEEAEEEDEEDEDLVIEGEHQSFVCPLSMQQITEPYSNHKCRHTFQKQSIVEWLNERQYKGRPRQCPEPGCNQSFTLKDFFYDELAMRKIQRARKRQAEEEAEEERGGQEEEEEEDGKVVASSSGVKRERKRRAVDDIEDEDEE